MWISKAFAATGDNTVHLEALSEAPSAFDAFITNVGLLAVLIVLFYVLLIMPQQRRFKEHAKMLSDLKKGDNVVTGGGLLGKIEKIINDQEVLLDLGNGVKVTALRSSIQGRGDVFLKAAANDAKEAKPAAKAEKKEDKAPVSKPKKTKSEKPSKE